jgi:hypothetical protein
MSGGGIAEAQRKLKVMNHLHFLDSYTIDVCILSE